MSHTMNIKTEIHNIEALFRVCERLGYPCEYGTHNLFAEKGIEGWAVKLPGWTFPAIVLRDGSVKCDTYNGKWGSMDELGKLQAHYGLDVAREAAWNAGYTCTESLDETGNLVLTIDM